MPSIEVNKKAPDFTMKDYKGEDFTLSSFIGESNILIVLNRGFM